jgi:hypothetical protein
LQSMIDDKKRMRENDAEGSFQDTEVIDEEEFAYFKELKAKKASYREAFMELKQVKDEVVYLGNLVQQGRHRLMTEFDRCVFRALADSMRSISHY